MRHTLDFEKTISDLQDKIAKLKDSGSDKTSLVEVNEQILTVGKDFQHGVVKELEKWKTIIWIDAIFEENVNLLIR